MSHQTNSAVELFHKYEQIIEKINQAIPILMVVGELLGENEDNQYIAHCIFHAAELIDLPANEKNPSLNYQFYESISGESK